jgi:hypothetical protein
MFTKINSAALAAAVLLFAGTIRADATAVTYGNFALWSAAASGYTPLSIPKPTPGPDDLPHSQYFEMGMVTYNGVTFSTSALGNGFLFNIEPGFERIPGEPGFNGNLPILSSQQGVANILITLAAPVKAFALNFDTFNVTNESYGYDVIFQLSNGSDPLTLSSPGNAYDLTGFFGVIDDTPFKTILLTSSGPVLSINELNIGAAVAPIPEPATWIMLLLGLAGITRFGIRLPARHASAC